MCFGLLTTACQWLGGSEPDNAIARVNDRYLYRSQLTGLVSEGTETEDSMMLVKAYIDNWVREELLLAEANDKLSGRLKDFEEKLEDYKRSLLIYTLENEVIATGIDTLVDEQLIETYFELNKEQFQLRDPIFKARYVKIEKGAPKTNDLRRWITSKRSRDEKSLVDYCLQYASSYHLNDSVWFYVEEVLRSMPREKMQDISFSQRNTLTETEDDQYQYFLFVFEHRDVGNEPPISLERNNIRDLILLQRRQQSIARYVDELYKRAETDQKFEIYP